MSTATAPTISAANAVRGNDGDALPHLAQLDAVRAIAIVGVMAAHFFGAGIVQEGARGVTLFFVLSGFLITGILLKCKGYVERDGQSISFTLRQFYVRRFLRIFPLYYLVIAVLWLIHDPGARHSIGWLLAYLGNVEWAVQGYPPWWSVQHFWSLGVEEQFYLVWPCVILLVPRRRLLWVVVAVVCCGPAFRVISGKLGMAWYARMPLPFFWLDALGLGALLAVASDASYGVKHLIRPGRMAALLGGAAAIALGVFLRRYPKLGVFGGASYYGGYALVSVWLVSKAADGFTGMAGRVMSFRPLVWIGAISYGIYVYHLVIITYWRNIPSIHLSPWEDALILTPIIVLVSAASYYFYERPINSLKRYVSYRATSSNAPIGSVTPSAAS
jgi:peptidoglycan/LPS O-acetylase OafA/YrhL